MIVIIGLGNPGKKHENNRHNVGKMFIDYLTKKSKINKEDKNLKIKTFKTTCFMNESGKEVLKIIKNLKFKIKNLIVVHDDLDIPLGKFRIDFARGPKLHRGINSIEETLKTKKFWRVRVGVDNREKTGFVNGETYVLQDFSSEEKDSLEKEVFLEIVKKLPTIVDKIRFV